MSLEPAFLLQLTKQVAIPPSVQLKMTNSWIEIDPTSDFSLQNLPCGVFSTDGTDARPGVATGQYVLDLQVLSREKCFGELAFEVETLDGLP